MADHNQVFILLIGRYEQADLERQRAGRALKRLMYTTKRASDSFELQPTKWYAYLKQTGYVYSPAQLVGASPEFFYQSSGKNLIPIQDVLPNNVFFGRKYASFIRACNRFDKAIKQYDELKTTLNTLNRLNLGTKIQWGRGQTTANKIRSVRTADKKNVPVSHFVTDILIEANE